MSLLDSTVYDLTSIKGQQQAIQDIIDEQNDQFEKSSVLNSLQVAAYAQMEIDFPDSPADGLYTATFRHGLGFVPVIMAFIRQDDGSGNISYLAIPNIQNLIFGFADNIYMTVDENNVYFNTFFVSALFVTQAAVYMFNQPSNI